MISYTGECVNVQKNRESISVCWTVQSASWKTRRFISAAAECCGLDSWNEFHEHQYKWITGKMIYYIAGLSLTRIPTLAAYKRAWRIFVGYAKRIRKQVCEPLLKWSCIYMMRSTASYICRNIEAVTTRRSWKFAVALFRKCPKSLATLDVFDFPTKQKIILSKTFSKKFANLKT